jgi:hypothetical protein
MKPPRITTLVDADTISAELESLLLGVYRELSRRPIDRASLKGALYALLEYLSSPVGRTNANCVATDHFFCLREGWDVELDDVPTDFSALIEDLGGALHDTVKAPHVARNFESTPEQLLDRLRRIPAE